MSLKQTIETKLRRALAPARLVVIDNSEKHIGHAGYRAGGESHWKVIIVSDAFSGKSRLERQRMVNEVLAAELNGPIHALEMDLRGEGE